jgi:S-formylglutathione hydrolase FrmB
MLNNTLRLITLLCAVLLLCPVAFAETADITFFVRPENSLAGKLPKNGRLFVILSRHDNPEPRFGPGDADNNAEPFFGKDIKKWDGRKPMILSREAVGFPVLSLKDLPEGQWYAQALYKTNTLSSFLNAPGNTYGPPVEINVDASKRQAFVLTLSQQVPPETVPPDTDTIKYVKIQSKLLTKFWKKPMYLRAGVILPAGYNDNPLQRYPIRYHIGGYHDRYTEVTRLASSIPDDAPPMITVMLDGEAPFGDSYQMNSANNGPYADATLQELIPYIETKFRAIGRPDARFTDGGSTGGWVALALQIYYPDFFNGAWSFYSDGVDFRRFQRINIYSDDNAFTKDGQEVPSMRDIMDNVRYTVRREVQMENALGRGNSYVTSGEQWGGWNAVYGPHDKRTGFPMPIWNPTTGKINHKTAQKWRIYDLRDFLASHWSKIGPKLQGKLHIWIGDNDNYYLNEAMHLMDDFLRTTQNPHSDAQIVFGMGQGHGWEAISQADRMRQMVARVGIVASGLRSASRP